MKILLIEDTETHAQLARHALMVHDPTIQIKHVETAEEGLEEILGGAEYEMILADYYLPGMSGLQFLRAIRDKLIDIPVVMITSQGQIKVAVECLKSGANDYVAKDEGYVDLLPNTVESVVRRFRAERENQELQNQILRKKEELETSNQKLMDYQRQIIHSEKMSAMVTLVRGICHELNNPLTGILGYAQLLQEAIKGEGAEDLKEIETCAQRCRDIISKLAKFCRVEKIAVAAVDVNEVLDDSITFVQYYANRHRVKILRDLQLDLPPTMASVHDLRQAFLAVLLNAIQAMPKGGTLTLKSSLRGQLVYVSVIDTGEGIPAENLEQIFTPFFTTREVGDGSGMGLAIAYGIMQDHGGEILVDSTVGEGSTFTFVFPLRQVAVVQTAGAPRASIAGQAL